MIWALVAIAFFFAVLALALWTLRRETRMFPPGTHVGDPEHRKPELRWIGWIHGGGHG